MNLFDSCALVRVAGYGGLVVLAASIWAWATGFAVWHGTAAAAVPGLAIGVYLDRMMRELWEPGDLTSYAAPVVGGMFIALMLVISIVGAIVVIIW